MPPFSEHSLVFYSSLMHFCIHNALTIFDNSLLSEANCLLSFWYRVCQNYILNVKWYFFPKVIGFSGKFISWMWFCSIFYFIWDSITKNKNIKIRLILAALVNWHSHLAVGCQEYVFIFFFLPFVLVSFIFNDWFWL